MGAMEQIMVHDDLQITVQDTPKNRTAATVWYDAMRELQTAFESFPKGFASSHEGFAVLKEEVDELWDVVKMNPRKISVPHPSAIPYEGIFPTEAETKAWQDAERIRLMRKEAIQVAAMALRFVVDVCDAPPAKSDPTAAPQFPRGGWPTPAPKPSADEIRRKILQCLADSDGFIHAIKLHRELTGSSLKDAKDYVDNIRAEPSVPVPTPSAEQKYVVRIEKTYPGDPSVYAKWSEYDDFTCTHERTTMSLTEARKLRDKILSNAYLGGEWQPKVRRASTRRYVVRVASFCPGDTVTYAAPSVIDNGRFRCMSRKYRPTMSLAEARKLRDLINAADGEDLMPRVQRARA